MHVDSLVSVGGRVRDCIISRWLLCSYI